MLESVEPRLDGTVDSDTEIIGRVLVEAGAQISGSRIVGSAIIGAGSKIIGSYIGPFTAIASDCTVDDTEIEYSIVLRGASFAECGESRHLSLVMTWRSPRC